jgi:hypothetical protein
MADEEQLAVLRQGSDAWNAWMEQNGRVRVDLSEAADLTEAYLAGTGPEPTAGDAYRAGTHPLDRSDQRWHSCF